MVASVARVRLLVVVMGQVKQTCSSGLPVCPYSGQPWTVVPNGSVRGGDFHSRGCDLHRYGGEISNDRVGDQLGTIVRCGQGHGRHPGRPSGPQPGGGVLEDHAAGRVDAEATGREEVRLGEIGRAHV